MEAAGGRQEGFLEALRLLARKAGSHRGATASADGDQSARTATLYMPHPIGAKLSRKDKVMPGVCGSPVPPSQALTVQPVAALRIGRSAHHYELTLA